MTPSHPLLSPEGYIVAVRRATTTNPTMPTSSASAASMRTGRIARVGCGGVLSCFGTGSSSSTIRREIHYAHTYIVSRTWVRYTSHMRSKVSSMQIVAIIIALFLAILLALPTFIRAFPYGGQISQIIFCYNEAIFARTGPPVGGDFIWTPSTRTYQFGPPQHAGQWHLGLAGPPYYCVVSIDPVIVWPGILITMMGSSQ